jgi:cytochrome c oxidase subunit 2
MKEIAAIVTYERNAWGNNTGDAVQAADVQAVVSGGSTTSTAVNSAVSNVTDIVKEKVAQVKEQITPAEDLTKTYTLAEQMAAGEKVYMAHCVACHQASGAGMPPMFPALKGSAIATGDVAAHLNIVLHGSAKNPAMRAFSGAISMTDLSAVITYERNAWGNNTGDVVQPADVQAASAK